MLVNIICPVMYIIFDTEGVKKLCGCFLYLTLGSVQRHC